MRVSDEVGSSCKHSSSLRGVTAVPVPGPVPFPVRGGSGWLVHTLGEPSPSTHHWSYNEARGCVLKPSRHPRRRTLADAPPSPNILLVGIGAQSESPLDGASQAAQGVLQAALDVVDGNLADHLAACRAVRHLIEDR